jgi:hypothetical protein
MKRSADLHGEVNIEDTSDLLRRIYRLCESFTLCYRPPG